LYAGENAYPRELEKLRADVERVRNHYKVSPDLIVVTGDIAESSAKVEYDVARTFLAGLAAVCGIPTSQLLVVPGNHDIHWKLCQAARLRSEALGVEFKPSYYPKFEMYEAFLNGFYPPTMTDPAIPSVFRFTSELFVIYPFPELGLLAAGLNSCVRESERDEDHYGWVDIDQTIRAIQVCDRIDPNRKLFRIALMHHNFRQESPYDIENLRDAGELEVPLWKGGFKVILHGHQHIPKLPLAGSPHMPLYVLATGSAGLDGKALPENARRYQYIVFEGSRVDVYRRRFDAYTSDETGMGCWVPDSLPENLSSSRGKQATISFTMG
jgi:3',5'-cyclic AMP phosphodiesterase CpdA